MALETIMLIVVAVTGSYTKWSAVKCYVICRNRSQHVSVVFNFYCGHVLLCQKLRWRNEVPALDAESRNSEPGHASSSSDRDVLCQLADIPPRWLSRLHKNNNYIIKEKINIENSVLDYIKYKQLNWHGWSRAKNEWRRSTSSNFGMVPTWKKKKKKKKKEKKRKTSTFMDAGNNNRN